MSTRRLLQIAVVLVCAFVVASAVVRSSLDESGSPSPSPSAPIVVADSGRICFSDHPLQTCSGATQKPTFYAGDDITYYIQMPFPSEAYVHIHVSSLNAGVAVPVPDVDIQVIQNPDGVYNRIGPALSLNSDPNGPTLTFSVDAYLGGIHVAEGTSYLGWTHLAQGTFSVSGGKRPPSAT